MFIKLAGHFLDNPQHIDKVIVINGLPDEWIFKPSRFGGKELVKPWEPDVEENIPKSVRNLCEEHEIVISYSPIEKGKESVVDKKITHGLRIDFSREPGQELWTKIERYMDRMASRDQKIVKPALFAPNHKSDFNPHEAYRTVRGSIELRACEVPVINLPVVEEKKIVEPIAKPVEVKKVEEESDFYECRKCGKKFTELNKLRGHNLTGHRKIEQKIGV